MTNPSGYFQTSNGAIVDPNGNAFVAHGINVMEGNEPSAATLQQDFPGINFVRLAIYDYASPDSLASYVNDLTSHGIVVELEDHNNNAGNAGGSQGQIFTGQALDTELNWYSAIASAFQNNPDVWFGTNNEPSEIDSSGNTNPAALSDWQKATYDAIRNAGNSSPILLEANGWSNNGQPVMAQGYNAADYSGMTNTIWDIHFYGWLTGYSTDQGTNDSFLNQMAQQVQQIQGADGTMPVLVGEYGNSTTGMDIDANGYQVVQAVQDSGLNSAAWAWGQGNPGDGLINGDGSLSGYGQQVAAGITAAAAQAPAPVQVSPAPPVSSPAQDSGSTPAGTQPATGSSTPASTASAITLNVAEDAGQGDAQFTVSVDGQQVGGVMTASALQSSGDSNVFTLTGDWGQGAHDVQVQFLNGPNLYVNTIGYDGTTYAGTGSALTAGGTADVTVGAATTAAPPDTLTVHLAEDAWNGDAQFTLSIDGQTVTTPQAVTASYSDGAWQDLTISGDFGSGTHDIGVTFTNDAYGGSSSTDRNLYVNGVDFNGTHYGADVTPLYSNDTAHFTV